MAELTAITAFRDCLLRTLPAKVDSINSARNAVLRAPLAGPYRFTGVEQFVLGKVIGTALGTVVPALGTYTAAELAAIINAVPLSGLTASGDSQGRLVITADAAPAVDAPSVVWLGPDAYAGSNAMFGWGPGGQEVVVSALVAPGYDGIRDGLDGHADMGPGFWLELAKRSAAPTDNIRRDITLVTLQWSLFAPEPMNRAGPAAMEFQQQAIRAVRECIYENRTLDGAVFLAEMTSAQSDGRNFRFSLGNGQSGLMSEAPLTVLIKIFERN